MRGGACPPTPHAPPACDRALTPLWNAPTSLDPLPAPHTLVDPPILPGPPCLASPGPSSADVGRGGRPFGKAPPPHERLHLRRGSRFGGRVSTAGKRGPLTIRRVIIGGLRFRVGAANRKAERTLAHRQNRCPGCFVLPETPVAHFSAAGLSRLTRHEVAGSELPDRRALLRWQRRTESSGHAA